MPLFEASCKNAECEASGEVFEYLQRACDPLPFCGRCGFETQREISRINVIWTGPLTRKYLDPTMEGAQGDGRDGAGHWAYRTRDTVSGKPEPVFIDSFQAQREYCKAEGLGLPQDSSPGVISADGKTLNPISKAEAKELRQENNEAIKKEKTKASA